MISKPAIRQLILDVCEELDFDNPTLLEAVTWKESNYKSDAIRFEPKFYKKYIAKLPRERLKSWNPGVGTELSELYMRFLCATSFGLMQVMGVVAYERGYRGVSLEGLLVPEVGLRFGCEILRDLLTKYTLERAISAYNAGSPTVLSDGTFRNQKYVNGVLENMRKLKQLEENDV